MDLILILIIWGVVGYFSSAKKKAQSDRRQKESGDPMPYAPAGKPASQAPAAKSNPGAAQQKSKKKAKPLEEWIPGKTKKKQQPQASLADQRAAAEKAAEQEAQRRKEKKAAPAGKKTPVQGSLTGYVSPEGPKHSQGISHRYGLDDCAPQEAAVSSIAEERDITNQLAQGMIWSQILGKPRSREPYFGRGR